MYIYIYIYIYGRGEEVPVLFQAEGPARVVAAEVGEAADDPDKRDGRCNHFLVGIAKASGCHCTDAFGGENTRIQIISLETCKIN